jgi:hypothetical protein
MMTASHCGTYQAQLEYNHWYQPSNTTSAGADTLGYEAYDTWYYNCGSLKCIPADVALVAYGGGRSGNFGAIASTTGFGSIIVDGTDAPIVGIDYSPLADEELEVLGRKSGWNVGVVTATCMNQEQYGYGFKVMCADHFDCQYLVPGDSGGPVYLGTSEGLVVYGVIWANNAFSNMGQIETALGGTLVAY